MYSIENNFNINSINIVKSNVNGKCLLSINITKDKINKYIKVFLMDICFNGIIYCIWLHDNMNFSSI